MSLLAVGVYAQGTINFNNRVVGSLVTHIYAPDIVNPSQQFTGNTSSDTPSGTQVYTGVPIGGSSTGTSFANGNRFTAQLWALGGTGNAASSLQAVTQYTSTFRTGGAGFAGWFNALTLSGDTGIPNAPNYNATIQLRVWDNQGGTVPDWATAVTTFGDAHGASPTFDLSNLGNNPAFSPPSNPPNLVGLQSFSLTQTTPEPSTIALGVMGAAAFLLRRRNK